MPKGHPVSNATREKISKALKEGYASGRLTHRSGFKHSKSTRRKISESLVRHFREEIAQRQGEPDHKRCCICSVPKPVEDFPIRRNRNLKSGVVSISPYSYCKKCCAEKQAAYRANLKARGKMKEASKRWYEGQDQERKKERQREREWDQRRREGKPLRPSARKYTPEKEGGTVSGKRFPAAPLVEFLEEEIKRRGEQVVRVRLRHAFETPAAAERRLYSLLEREQENTSLRTIDRCLNALGRPDLLTQLAPEEFRDLHGYHYITA